MSDAFAFMVSLIPTMVFLALYAIPTGLVYGAARTHYKRATEIEADAAFWISVALGVGWFLTVPWFVFSRATTAIDPEVRATKKAVEAERLAEVRAREAKAIEMATRAEFNEEVARRQLERLGGAEIPYTREEELVLEASKENIAKAIESSMKTARNAQEAIEASKARSLRYDKGY